MINGGAFFIMFSLIQSASVYGVEGKNISVEVDISSGLPQVIVVGLPDPAVRDPSNVYDPPSRIAGLHFH